MHPHHGRRAFTLIELMIVVAIIGILASIAIPDLILFNCRAKQAEGKANTRAMFALQEGFRAEHDKYACINDDGLCDPEDNLVFIPQGRTRYSYFASTDAPDAFYAQALGISDAVSGDLWTVTEKNDLEHEVDACR